MKIEIALAKSLKYTGTSGLYSSVYLTAESKKDLNAFCKASGLGALTDDAHCTIMYSTVAIAPKFATKYSASEYEALAKKVTWWAGHDNAGYVVLKLDSRSMCAEHHRLKKAGCLPTFTPYEAHVTLISPKQFENNVEAFNFCKAANDKLNLSKLKLTFSNQQVEDLQ